MKPRQFIVLLIAIVAVGLGAYTALNFWWQPPPPPPPLEAGKLIAAVQAYSRDRKEQAQPVPPVVNLRELVAGGYLGTNEVRSFEGAEVTFRLDADFSLPRAVMIRVRLRDGSQMVVLANGTVEQIPK